MRCMQVGDWGSGESMDARVQKAKKERENESLESPQAVRIASLEEVGGGWSVMKIVADKETAVPGGHCTTQAENSASLRQPMSKEALGCAERAPGKQCLYENSVSISSGMSTSTPWA
jgi:hypothetical protein